MFIKINLKKKYSNAMYVSLLGWIFNFILFIETYVAKNMPSVWIWRLQNGKMAYPKLSWRSKHIVAYLNRFVSSNCKNELWQFRPISFIDDITSTFLYFVSSDIISLSLKLLRLWVYGWKLTVWITLKRSYNRVRERFSGWGNMFFW